MIFYSVRFIFCTTSDLPSVAIWQIFLFENDQCSIVILYLNKLYLLDRGMIHLSVLLKLGYNDLY